MVNDASLSTHGLLVSFANFIGDDTKTVTHNFIRHCKTDTQAFISVTPLRVVNTEEEVVSRHNKDAACL